MRTISPNLTACLLGVSLATFAMHATASKDDNPTIELDRRVLTGSFIDKDGISRTVKVAVDQANYRNSITHKGLLIPESHKKVVLSDASVAPYAGNVSCPFDGAGSDSFSKRQLPLVCSWRQGAGPNRVVGEFTMGLDGRKRPDPKVLAGTNAELDNPTEIQLDAKTRTASFVAADGNTYNVSLLVDAVRYRAGSSHNEQIKPESHKLQTDFEGPGWKVKCPAIAGPGLRTFGANETLSCTWKQGKGSKSPSGFFGLSNSDTGVQVSKTLTGVVTDGPIPNATVSVTIGGVTYTTTADELGRYSLPILTTSVGELVKVEASGVDPETGTPIEFVNFAGSFERIVEDEPQNVTNVTTAGFVLAVEANNGVEPQTFEELQAAETAINADELFQLASVIKLIVDDPDYALPAGFDNVLDFVQDDAAVDTFVAVTADPADLDAALEEILNDSDLVAGFTADSVPDRYIEIPTTSPGFIARSGTVLEFDRDTQRGQILSFSQGNPIDQSFSWTIDSGRLALVYDTPVVEGAFFNDENELLNYGATQAQVDLLIAEENNFGTAVSINGAKRTVESRYTRVTDGALVDVANVENVVRWTFEPFVLNDGNIVQVADFEEIETETSTLRSNTDIQPTPFTATCGVPAGAVCAVGRWGGNYRYGPGQFWFGGGDEWPATSYGEVIDFAGDFTAAGIISGVASDWSIDNGTLVISYDGGATTQRVTLLDNVGIEYGALSEFTTPEGRFVVYDVWVRGQEGLLFDSAELITTGSEYWNGEINTGIPGSFNDDGTRKIDVLFGWQFSAISVPTTPLLQGDVTSVPLVNAAFNPRGDVDPVTNENVVSFFNVGWELLDGGQRLKIDRFRDVDFVNNPDFFEGLRPTFDRFWYPIAKVDDPAGKDVIYVMEVEFRTGDYPAQAFIPARLNIQRKLDFSSDFNVDRQDNIAVNPYAGSFTVSGGNSSLTTTRFIVDARGIFTWEFDFGGFIGLVSDWLDEDGRVVVNDFGYTFTVDFDGTPGSFTLDALDNGTGTTDNYTGTIIPRP